MRESAWGEHQASLSGPCNGHATKRNMAHCARDTILRRLNHHSSTYSTQTSPTAPLSRSHCLSLESDLMMALLCRQENWRTPFSVLRVGVHHTMQQRAHRSHLAEEGGLPSRDVQIHRQSSLHTQKFQRKSLESCPYREAILLGVPRTSAMVVSLNYLGNTAVKFPCSMFHAGAIPTRLEST